MNTNAADQTNNKSDIAFEPAFTEEQVYKAEDEYNTTWGIKRRIMMLVLSKSGKSMADMLESMLSEDETAEAYFSMIEQLNDYEKHLKAGIELAQAATARLLMVAQHVAGNEVEPTESA